MNHIYKQNTDTSTPIWHIISYKHSNNQLLEARSSSGELQPDPLARTSRRRDSGCASPPPSGDAWGLWLPAALIRGILSLKLIVDKPRAEDPTARSSGNTDEASPLTHVSGAASKVRLRESRLLGLEAGLGIPPGASGRPRATTHTSGSTLLALLTGAGMTLALRVATMAWVSLRSIVEQTMVRKGYTEH